MLDRIKELMEYKDLSASQFADNMDVPRAVVSHVLSGRNKPSLDVVLKIASTYTDVNLDWLMLGKGKMLNIFTADAEASKEIKQTDVTVRSESIVVQDNDSLIGKVQKDAYNSYASKPEKFPDREIKQVMIFYSDGTFEPFKPSF